MNKRVLSLFLCVVFLAGTHVAFADRFKGLMRFEAIVLGKTENVASAYIDSIEIDVKHKSVKYGRNVVTELTVCEERGWYCLSDGYIEFAIPLDCCNGRKVWSRDRVNYTVIDSDDAMGGEIISVLATDDKDSTSPGKVYRYSKTKGLVGIFTYIEEGAGSRFPAFYVRR